MLASVRKLQRQVYMTADILKQLNDVFDLLNVRVYGKKVASPIAADSIQYLKIRIWRTWR